MIRSWSAYLLALILAIAVLVMFIPRPWINPSLFQTGLFLLGAAWATALTVRPLELRFSLPMIPLSCAVIWGLLQPLATREAVLVWAGNLLAFVLALQICASPRVRQRFLDTLLYFASVLSVTSVVLYFGWTDRTAFGPFVNRDQYAAFIEMLLPLALLRAFDGGSRAMGFAAVSAAMYASVIAGASRAGALLVTAEVIAVPLALSATHRRVRSAAIKLALLLLAFVAVAGWALLWNRFTDPDPFQGRREMLSGTLAMVHSRPWTGFGLGTFRTVYPAYAPVDFGAVVNHAHNDWAEWTAEGGIPFGLLLLSIAIWSIPKALRTVWGIGLLAVFAHSMVDYPLHVPVLELWLFTLLGALAAETCPAAE